MGSHLRFCEKKNSMGRNDDIKKCCSMWNRLITFTYSLTGSSLLKPSHCRMVYLLLLLLHLPTHKQVVPTSVTKVFLWRSLSWGPVIRISVSRRRLEIPGHQAGRQVLGKQSWEIVISLGTTTMRWGERLGRVLMTWHICILKTPSKHTFTTIYDYWNDILAQA